MIPKTDSFLSIPFDKNEGLLEYMWIGVSEGFIVTTATIRVDPFQATAIPVHFAVIDAGFVEVRLAGYDKWMSHALRQEGDTLWWTLNGQDVPWTFVPADTVPQWAHDLFARGKVKLQKDRKVEKTAPQDENSRSKTMITRADNFD